MRSIPPSARADAREWGTGQAEITAARTLAGGGGERAQFLAGEPFRLEVDLRAHAQLPPPRLHLEVRDTTGVLVAEEAVGTEGLGWPDGPGSVTVTLDVDRPTLEFGRFRVRLGLVAADGRTLHSLRRCRRLSRLPGRRRAGSDAPRRNMAQRRESG